MLGDADKYERALRDLVGALDLIDGTFPATVAEALARWERLIIAIDNARAVLNDQRH